MKDLRTELSKNKQLVIWILTLLIIEVIVLILLFGGPR